MVKKKTRRAIGLRLKTEKRTERYRERMKALNRSADSAACVSDCGLHRPHSSEG